MYMNVTESRSSKILCGLECSEHLWVVCYVAEYSNNIYVQFLDFELIMKQVCVCECEHVLVTGMGGSVEFTPHD